MTTIEVLNAIAEFEDAGMLDEIPDHIWFQIKEKLFRLEGLED